MITEKGSMMVSMERVSPVSYAADAWLVFWSLLLLLADVWCDTSLRFRRRWWMF